MKSITIFLTYNRLEYTKITLPVVYNSFKKLKDSKLIIYDDMSQDGTYEYIKDFIKDKENVELVQKQYGNGWKQVEETILNNDFKYLIKIDNDILIPDCLVKVVELADKSPNHAIFGFKPNKTTFSETKLDEDICVYQNSREICNGVGLYRKKALENVFPINLKGIKGAKYAGFQLIRKHTLKNNKWKGSWIRGLFMVDLNRHPKLSRVFEYDKKGFGRLFGVDNLKCDPQKTS